VLGGGRVLEFDVPEVLLSNDASEFSLLVNQTGEAEAEHLRMLASNVGAKTRSDPPKAVTTIVQGDVADRPSYVGEENDPLLV
jgi:hypothetical protein